MNEFSSQFPKEAVPPHMVVHVYCLDDVGFMLHKSVWLVSSKFLLRNLDEGLVRFLAYSVKVVILILTHDYKFSLCNICKFFFQHFEKCHTPRK